MAATFLTMMSRWTKGRPLTRHQALRQPRRSPTDESDDDAFSVRRLAVLCTTHCVSAPSSIYAFFTLHASMGPRHGRRVPQEAIAIAMASSDSESASYSTSLAEIHVQLHKGPLSLLNQQSLALYRCISSSYIRCIAVTAGPAGCGCGCGCGSVCLCLCLKPVWSFVCVCVCFVFVCVVCCVCHQHQHRCSSASQHQRFQGFFLAAASAPPSHEESQCRATFQSGVVYRHLP